MNWFGNIDNDILTINIEYILKIQQGEVNNKKFCQIDIYNYSKKIVYNYIIAIFTMELILPVSWIYLIDIQVYIFCLMLVIHLFIISIFNLIRLFKFG